MSKIKAKTLRCSKLINTCKTEPNQNQERSASRLGEKLIIGKLRFQKCQNPRKSGIHANTPENQPFQAE